MKVMITLDYSQNNKDHISIKAFHHTRDILPGLVDSL